MDLQIFVRKFVDSQYNFRNSFFHKLKDFSLGHHRGLTLLSITVAFAAWFFLRPIVGIEFQPKSAFVQNSPLSWISELPLGPLQQAFSVLKQNYFWYETLQKEALVEGMIQGMMGSLKDKHSLYLDPSETENFNQAIRGNFEWIWAYVWKTQSGVVIRQTFEWSPAREAGILEWDILVSANSEKLADLSLEEAVKKIKWPAGTEVELAIMRPNTQGILKKKVTRRSVQVPSVISKMVEGTTGLITVWIFWETTPKEFLTAYSSLTQSGMTGLIIDLRDNPGWLLSTSVAMLEQFIPSGDLLVETRSNTQELTQKYFSEWPGDKKIPIVVLINENSASASEIFAGAIQDYGRGIVVGSQSYGKWSVQEIFPLSNAGEIKVTVARWYTPKWKWIDGVGIKPDVEVTVEPKDFENKIDRILIEWKKQIQKMRQSKK
jgi:carboxyl-terminal processing protease